MILWTEVSPYKSHLSIQRTLFDIPSWYRESTVLTSISFIKVENEYGSYGCDQNYLQQMESMIRHYVGEDVILFTTDPIVDQAVQCGSISTLFRTIDFGAGNDVKNAFAIQRKYQPQGPYVCKILYQIYGFGL